MREASSNSQRGPSSLNFGSLLVGQAKVWQSLGFAAMLLAHPSCGWPPLTICTYILLQTVAAVQLLTEQTAPSKISRGCLNALVANVSCSPMVPRFRYGFYYSESTLIRSCTSQCESALASYETNIISACNGDTWSGYDDEGSAPLSLIPNILRYQYSLTCLQDSGRWCNVLAGNAAGIADPGGKKSVAVLRCQHAARYVLI